MATSAGVDAVIIDIAAVHNLSWNRLIDFDQPRAGEIASSGIESKAVRLGRGGYCPHHTYDQKQRRSNRCDQTNIDRPDAREPGHCSHRVTSSKIFRSSPRYRAV